MVGAFTPWNLANGTKMRLLFSIKELKAGSLRDPCIPTLISALVIAAKTWMQANYPPMDEWGSKMWLYNGISHAKRN
jgi:hypothetical protein